MSLLGAAIVGGLNTIAGWTGIGEGRQDRRQVEQDKKLGEQALDRNKRAADYEQELKLKMWKDTNYKAQLEQADMAGVSKAAVLGGGVGGTAGASVSSPGSSSAADAASTSNAKTAMIANGMQLASQLALQKAQKENIEADTANKQAEAGNTGVKTQTGKLDLKVKESTYNEAVDKIIAEAGKAQSEAAIQWRNNKMDEATVRNRIEKIQTEAIGAVLNNEKTKAETRVKEAEATIQKFEAEATKSGISTKAPWYIKLMSDLYHKIDTLNKMEQGGK